MTLVAIVGALLLGAAIGATIEARRPDPIPEDASLLVELHYARRDADYWHDEYHRTRKALKVASDAAVAWKRRSVAWEHAAKKWHTTCRQHETILAALGRTVAEGGTVTEEESA